MHLPPRRDLASEQAVRRRQGPQGASRLSFELGSNSGCVNGSTRLTRRVRQGNDIGDQYRSAIFTVDAQQQATAIRVRDDYQRALSDAGYGPITTQITEATPWYYAEDYHQQYLAWNPNGYCPVHATGVACRAS